MLIYHHCDSTCMLYAQYMYDEVIEDCRAREVSMNRMYSVFTHNMCSYPGYMDTHLTPVHSMREDPWNPLAAQAAAADRFADRVQNAD